MVFCPATQLYVMYFHLDHYRPRQTPHYHWRRVGIATAAFAVGPFTLRRVLRPDGLPSLDLTLHQVLLRSYIGVQCVRAKRLRAPTTAQCQARSAPRAVPGTHCPERSARHTQCPVHPVPGTRTARDRRVSR